MEEKIQYPYLRMAVMFEDIRDSIKQFHEQLKTSEDICDWDNPEWKILVDKSGEAYAEFQKLDEEFRI